MLSLDPGLRITASEALRHPYFDLIRPRRQRFQKTSETWITSKNVSKISLADTLTDRNSRNSEAMNLSKGKSIDK